MQPVLAGECVGGAWESYKTFSATNITVHFVTCNQVEVKQGNYLDRKRGGASGVFLYTANPVQKLITGLSHVI